MIDIDRCWVWPGRIRKEDGRAMASRDYAYRTVYEAATGIALGPNVGHHTCENPACINPWHIDGISQSDHVKGHGLPGDWGQADKTHCPWDHPYDEENTYVDPNGGRHCRKCRRRNKQRYEEKKRGTQR